MKLQNSMQERIKLHHEIERILRECATKNQPLPVDKIYENSEVYRLATTEQQVRSILNSLHKNKYAIKLPYQSYDGGKHSVAFMWSNFMEKLNPVVDTKSSAYEKRVEWTDEERESIAIEAAKMIFDSKLQIGRLQAVKQAQQKLLPVERHKSDGAINGMVYSTKPELSLRNMIGDRLTELTGDTMKRPVEKPTNPDKVPAANTSVKKEFLKQKEPNFDLVVFTFGNLTVTIRDGQNANVNVDVDYKEKKIILKIE